MSTKCSYASGKSRDNVNFLLSVWVKHALKPSRVVQGRRSWVTNIWRRNGVVLRGPLGNTGMG